MRYVSYQIGGEQRLGIVQDDQIREIALEGEPRGRSADVVDAAVTDWQETAKVFDKSNIDVRLPVSRPGKIVGVGLNYHDHADEVGKTPPDEPRIWSKAPTAALAPGDSIVYPYETKQLDYECELAVVIGREGRRIDFEDALDYVAGFTAFNDVSARDIQASVEQNFRGKGFDTFAPMGPVLTTPDEIHHDTLSIRTIVNGEVRQDSSTAKMIFSVEELIEYISSSMTLLPGDIIATGTPPGVGLHRDPPGLLEPGDTVTIELEGVGELENEVVREEPKHE